MRLKEICFLQSMHFNEINVSFHQSCRSLNFLSAVFLCMLSEKYTWNSFPCLSSFNIPTEPVLFGIFSHFLLSPCVLWTITMPVSLLVLEMWTPGNIITWELLEMQVSASTADLLKQQSGDRACDLFCQVLQVISNVHWNLKTTALEDRSANDFHEGPDSKYFRLWEPDGLCCGLPWWRRQERICLPM